VEQKNNWSKTLLKILSQAVNVSVLIAALTFIAGEQQRRDLQVYQAWQVINSAANNPGSDGRVRALEFLNSEPTRIPWFWLHWEKESLVKLEAPKAYLFNANLQGAYLFNANLQGALLRQANLQGADLKEANLQDTYLGSANLQRAILKQANLQRAILVSAKLQGADLIGADLQGVHLGSANLQGANLKETQLQNAKYTDNSTNQETCKFIFEKYPCPTIFPNNFDPKAAGMELVK
jgi:Pentapeptide repeats (8 copies)